MTKAALVLLAILTIATAWSAGEQHRGNCIAAGHASCTIVPWDNGSTARTTTSRPCDGNDQLDRLNRTRGTC